MWSLCCAQQNWAVNAAIRQRHLKILFKTCNTNMFSLPVGWCVCIHDWREETSNLFLSLSFLLTANASYLHTFTLVHTNSITPHNPKRCVGTGVKFQKNNTKAKATVRIINIRRKTELWYFKNIVFYCFYWITDTMYAHSKTS